MRHFLRAGIGFVLIGSFAGLGCKKPAPPAPPSQSSSSSSGYATAPGESFPARIAARNAWVVVHLDETANKFRPISGTPHWKMLDFNYSGDKYSVEAEPNLSRPDGTKLRFGFTFNDKNEGTLVQAEEWDIKASTWTTRFKK